MLRLLRLHLPSYVGVGSAYGCRVSDHHLASNMLRYFLRANWSDAIFASDGVRTAGT
jgi:hypothetical protein